MFFAEQNWTGEYGDNDLTADAISEEKFNNLKLLNARSGVMH
jgi:hypothetical protein